MLTHKRINVIGYYSTILYENLGIDGDRNLLVTGIYNIVGPIFNLIFIVFFLDRVGRKKPLIFGTIGISIALICEAALGSQVNGSSLAQVFSSCSWCPASSVSHLAPSRGCMRPRSCRSASVVGAVRLQRVWVIGKLIHTYC
jgi:MFS family permease